MRKHIVTWFLLALLPLWMLACSGGGGVSPSGLAQSGALVQTAAAVSTAAQAAHNANAAEATRVVEMTLQASEATAAAAVVAATGTAYAFNAQATSQALEHSGTATAVAFQVAITVTNQAMTAVADDLSAKATAVQSGVNAEATRQEAEGRKAQAEAQRAENMAAFMAYAPWIAVLFFFLGFVTLVAIYFHRHRPMMVRENGRDHILVLNQGGYQRIGPAPARLIDVTPQPQLEAPDEPLALPAPRVIHLPDELPEGKIGLGVLLDDGQPLWLRPAGVDILGAGAKGSGKSTFARSLADQALVQGCELHLIDAETVTFSPSLWGRVAKTNGDVEEMLNGIIQDFDDRFTLYKRAEGEVAKLPYDQQFFVDDLDSYNRAARMFHMPQFPSKLLLWDEANNHLGDTIINKALHELLRRNRKAGCGIAILAHTWLAKQVGNEIKTNLATRAVFRCSEATSRLLLNHPGASQLTGAGRAIFVSTLGERMMQSYYLPAGRVFRDVRRYRNRDDDIVEGEVLPPINFLPHRTQNEDSNPAGHVVDRDAERVHELRRQGVPLRRIAEQVYGSTGGADFYRVKEVLGLDETEEQ